MESSRSSTLPAPPYVPHTYSTPFIHLTCPSPLSISPTWPVIPLSPLPLHSFPSPFPFLSSPFLPRLILTQTCSVAYCPTLVGSVLPCPPLPSPISHCPILPSSFLPHPILSHAYSLPFLPYLPSVSIPLCLTPFLLHNFPRFHNTKGAYCFAFSLSQAI